jgi:centromere protein C
MPPSARKSSLDPSRRPQSKGHAPYRGDNPYVGRRTGRLLEGVEVNSDGFEPYELLKADDSGNPLTPRRQKRKSIQVMQDEDYPIDDEDGEQSMDIESKPIQLILFIYLFSYAGPTGYLTNVRRQSMPRKSLGGSSRVVARTSHIDYDRVPSPNSTPGKSRLRQASRLSKPFYPRDAAGDPISNGASGDMDMDMDNGFDDYPQDDAEPLRGHSSFGDIDRDDEEDMDIEQEDMEEDDLPPLAAKSVKPSSKASNKSGKGGGRADTGEGTTQDSDDAEQDQPTPRGSPTPDVRGSSKPRDKGKGKAAPSYGDDMDMDMEDGIDQNLPSEEYENDEPPPQPPQKKGKGAKVKIAEKGKENNPEKAKGPKEKKEKVRDRRLSDRA